jgi:hypothetical protein
MMMQAITPEDIVEVGAIGGLTHSFRNSLSMNPSSYGG